MNLKYIFIASLALVCIEAQGAVTQRNAAVGELAPYCAPASRPASPDIEFMPDGKSYVERSDDGKKLLVKDINSGKELSVLFDVTHTRETELPDFEGFILSPDASKIMVWRDSKPVYRRSSTAQYYVYEVRSRLLRPLSKEHSRQQIPMFSPDSRMVAFVADNNIYAAKLDYQTEVPVTTDGVKDSIINGATDWTYEVGIRRYFADVVGARQPHTMLCSLRRICRTIVLAAIIPRHMRPYGPVPPLSRRIELQIPCGRRGKLVGYCTQL